MPFIAPPSSRTIWATPIKGAATASPGANAQYGTPVNPRAPGRLPGASSSGSASAVASGACDFAWGSDTGGSVRVRAARF
jgi:Asp-tRNA(Asn)/Glu-tRNA(Gln) amidotransferase A subunit family amidase